MKHIKLRSADFPDALKILRDCAGEERKLVRARAEAERLLSEIQKGPFSSSLLCCAKFLLDQQ